MRKHINKPSRSTLIDTESKPMAGTGEGDREEG